MSVNNIEVIVNGSRVELDEKFSVSIKKNGVDLANLMTRRGNHSYSITFPSTTINRRIFGIRDVATPRAWSTGKKFTIHLSRQGIGMISGSVFIESYGPKAGFKGNIKDTNVDFKGELQRKKLRSLTFPLVNFVGPYAWGAPFEPSPPLPQDTIWALGHTDTVAQWPMVAYGNYFDPNGLGSGITKNLIKDIRWDDFVPGIYVLELFKQIFREVGLNPVGSIFTDDWANAQVMTYSADREPIYNWGLLARVEVTKTAAHNYHMDKTTPGLDQSDIISASNATSLMRLQTDAKTWDYSESYYQVSPDESYIVPSSDDYVFTLGLDIIFTSNITPQLPLPSGLERFTIIIIREPLGTEELDDILLALDTYFNAPNAPAPTMAHQEIIAFYDYGATPSYQVAPFVNGSLINITDTFVYTPIFPGVNDRGNGRIEFTTPNIPLDRGDRVSAFLAIKRSGFNSGDWSITNYSLEVDNVTGEDLYQPALNLPDWTQLQFVTGIMNLFSLQYDLVGDTIIFEPYKDYFLSKETAMSLNKVDTEDLVSSEPPLFKESKFMWANDSNDVILRDYGNIFDHEIENENGIGTEKVEVPFAPIHERIYRTNATLPRPELVIPTMASEAQMSTELTEVHWSYNYLPRIVLYLGLQTGAWIYHGAVKATYPAARFGFDEVNNRSMCWGNAELLRIDRTQKITGATFSGVFDRYYAKVLYERTAGARVSGSITLDLAQFQKLGPRKLIEINGDCFIFLGLEPFAVNNPQPTGIKLFKK